MREQSITVAAKNNAELIQFILTLDDDTRASVFAVHNGQTWAELCVYPHAEYRLSINPLDGTGYYGPNFNPRNKGHRKVVIDSRDSIGWRTRVLRIAINRSRKMIREMQP